MKRMLFKLITTILLLASASRAGAVQVQDIVRLKGAEGGRLVGMGLVVGLPGTGDGGKFLPAMRPLAEITKQLLDPNVSLAELKDAKNVALVSLSVIVPDTGAREGDKLDVQVDAIAAKSLEHGRLFLIPMTGPVPGSGVYAFAAGDVEIETPTSPTSGIIHHGATMTRDLRTHYLDAGGRITLVLQDAYASWPVANNLANLINGIVSPDGPPMAHVADPKNVVVTLPPYERDEPAGFIAQVLQSYVDPVQISSGAVVVINEKKKSIIMSADVQISPVVVTIAGLTISSISPEPVPTAQNPKVERSNFIGVDPEKRGGARLQALLEALNRLKVSDDDRVTIVKELARAGKLNAKLIVE